MNAEALLYEKEGHDAVRCGLCAHRCRIEAGARGFCGVRENRAGRLVSLVSRTIVAAQCDPIEKKPLFHFLPGSRSYSIAAAGCNLRCTFCQNHEISQMPRDEGRIAGRDLAPAAIVDLALASGARSIAYTYTEPTVYFELTHETAGIARERGLRNVLVTNGYMTEAMLRLIAPRIDAANVDLKAFSEAFYRGRCGGRLEPVLASLRTMKELGIWVEVTTLLIPEINDGEDELRELAAFIRSLGAETPWHVSRFHPRYRMTETPPTPVATLHRAIGIGKAAGLNYVYSGNVPGGGGEDTTCARCGRLLIGRCGFAVERLDLAGSACPGCGTPLAGIF